MKMSSRRTSEGNGGVPGPLNTTGPKASKIDKVIGYIMRKRKSIKPTSSECDHLVVASPKPKQFTLPSQVGLIKLNALVEGKNRYQLLDLDMADRDMLGVEEDHWESAPEVASDGEISPLNVQRLGGTLKMLMKGELNPEGEPIKGVDAKDTRARVKPQKKKVIIQEEACCDIGCQSCGTTEPMQTDIPQYDKQLESLPRRLVAKLRGQKTSRFVYSQLLNHLRCKHFMHVRDTHFITTLVADARAWLLSKGYTMEDSIHYSILSSAVQQAFIVSAEELELRATLKNPKIRDHIDHLNATMSGDLGRVNMFDINSGKHALAKMARRPFTRSLHLSAPRTDLV
jgi:hypothetical protein